ncbi:MAG: transcriptional regulator, partial [Mycobacterium sp.]|nr:transcriptional regulator [Mycobacterium sp.]
MLDRAIELRHTGVVKFKTDPSPVPATVSATDGATRREIVRLLLESGSITAAEIGTELGISP